MKSDLLFDYDNLSVTKTVNTKEEYDKEMLVYGRHFSFVPGLISTDNDLTITIEMIQGHHISQESDFYTIGEHFSELHLIKSGELSLCHQDTNPKNYMYTSGKYYFIDFAESGFNYPEFDLIHFLLFWAEIADRETFKTISHDFLQGYLLKGQINHDKWQMIYNETVNKFDNRRKQFGKPNILSVNTINNRKTIEKLLNQ